MSGEVKMSGWSNIVNTTSAQEDLDFNNANAPIQYRFPEAFGAYIQKSDAEKRDANKDFGEQQELPRFDTETQWLNDPKVQGWAEKLYHALHPADQWQPPLPNDGSLIAQRAAYVRESDQARKRIYTPTNPKEFAEWGAHYMSWFNNNIPTMVWDYSRMRSLDQETIGAFLGMLDTYEPTSLNKRQVTEGIKAMVFDPLAVLGFSILLKGAVNGLTKNAIKSHLRGMMKRATSSAGKVGLIEATGYGATRSTSVEALRAQSQGRDIHPGTIAKETAPYAAGGYLLGRGLDGLIRAPGVVRQWIRGFRKGDSITTDRSQADKAQGVVTEVVIDPQNNAVFNSEQMTPDEFAAQVGVTTPAQLTNLPDEALPIGQILDSPGVIDMLEDLGYDAVTYAENGVAMVRPVIQSAIRYEQPVVVRNRLDELGYSSPAMDAVTGVKQDKAEGVQFIAAFENVRGAKLDAEQMGLTDFLNSKKSFTKEEVLDFIDDNRLGLVEEVRSGIPREARPVEFDLQPTRDRPMASEQAQVHRSEVYYQLEAYDDYWLNQFGDYLQEQKVIEFDDAVLTDWKFNRKEALDELIEKHGDEYADYAGQNIYENSPILEAESNGYTIIGTEDGGFTVKDPDGDPLTEGTPGGRFTEMFFGSAREAEAAANEHRIHTGGALYTGEEGVNPDYLDLRMEPATDTPGEIRLILPEDPQLNRDYLEAHRRRALVAGGKEDWSQWVEAETREEAVEKLQAQVVEASRRIKQVFEGDHYPEQNILVHTRFDTRQIGGKNTLHIDEIQSDWHQLGQKFGYFEGNRMDPSQSVPDAPFKKNWHELMFKRLLMEAAKDDSVQRISWTTADIQIARYPGKVKHIDEVKIERLPDADTGIDVNEDPRRYKVTTTETNSVTKHYGSIGEPELNKLLGKKYAQELMGESEHWQPGEEIINSNLNLEVGAKGFRDLYDQQLPQVAKRFGKKYGVKPKKMVQDNQEVWFIDFTDEMRGDIGTKGLPLTGVALLPFGVESLVQVEMLKQAESNNNPDAVSSKGARGAIQMMPSTYDGLKVDEESTGVPFPSELEGVSFDEALADPELLDMAGQFYLEVLAVYLERYGVPVTTKNLIGAWNRGAHGYSHDYEKGEFHQETKGLWKRYNEALQA
nr:hypothetical protein [uncultured Gammaproteobacteria bacterium]